MKQKIPQEPLHQLRWFPSPKGEALLSGSPLCIIGSPLGELSPQVTEGCFHKPFTLCKRFHEEPLHRLTTVPLVLSGPLCPAGISPPRGESPEFPPAFTKVSRHLPTPWGVTPKGEACQTFLHLLKNYISPLCIFSKKAFLSRTFSSIAKHTLSKCRSISEFRKRITSNWYRSKISVRMLSYSSPSSV